MKSSSKHALPTGRAHIKRPALNIMNQPLKLPPALAFVTSHYVQVTSDLSLLLCLLEVLIPVFSAPFDLAGEFLLACTWLTWYSLPHPSCSSQLCLGHSKWSPPALTSLQLTSCDSKLHGDFSDHHKPGQTPNSSPSP